MELKDIVERIANLVPVIDSNSTIQNSNRRNKRPYVKGVVTLFEPQFTKELVRGKLPQGKKNQIKNNVFEDLAQKR